MQWNLERQNRLLHDRDPSSTLPELLHRLPSAFGWLLCSSCNLLSLRHQWFPSSKSSGLYQARPFSVNRTAKTPFWLTFIPLSYPFYSQNSPVKPTRLVFSWPLFTLVPRFFSRICLQ